MRIAPITKWLSKHAKRPIPQHIYPGRTSFDEAMRNVSASSSAPLMARSNSWSNMGLTSSADGPCCDSSHFRLLFSYERLCSNISRSCFNTEQYFLLENSFRDILYRVSALLDGAPYCQFLILKLMAIFGKRSTSSVAAFSFRPSFLILIFNENKGYRR